SNETQTKATNSPQWLEEAVKKPENMPQWSEETRSQPTSTPQWSNSSWGDAFVPVTGNNSISRDSGKPDTAIAFNAGLRYLVGITSLLEQVINSCSLSIS
ncbi:MAG: hypothetical protein ACRDEA_20340, partial [Microcystaceae cyanobacterium]